MESGESARQNSELIYRLKRAVGNGDTTAVKRLIKGGVDINSPTFWYDSSLLHESIMAASPAVVEMLLNAKADVNSCSKDGRTPLHVACRSGQENIVQMLLDAGAKVNALTKDRRSALHIALWRGHDSIALKLIDSNADVRHKDEDDTTALHWACKTNLLTCVKRLLQAGACVNAPDKHGRTPLHEAIICSANRRLILYLISHGADPNIAPKIVRTTSLTLLLNHKECDVLRLVRLLLFVGYRLTSHDRLVVTSSGHNDVVESVCQHSRLVPTLGHLCRVSVRHRVVVSCRGQLFASCVDRLPLPGLLRDFVAFKTDF